VLERIEHFAPSDLAASFSIEEENDF